MQIEQVKISEIKMYARNAKKHPDKQVEQIVKSIKEFGFNDPIAIDENNVIIEGHGRYLASKKLKMEELPCIRLSHLSDKQKKAYILAHNKLTMNTGYNEELLNLELMDILELNDLDDLDSPINMDDFGFDMTEYDKQNAEEDDYELPDEIKTDIKQGDIFQIGEHRLMCGDSTKSEDVERLMNGELADMLLTDPPYNVDYTGGTGLKIMNDKFSDDNFRDFLTKFYKCAFEFIKKGASFYIWHADSEGYNFRVSAKDAGLKIRQCLIWVKNSMVMGRQDYQWKHEPCLYGWKDGASHFWNSNRKQTTVLEFDRPSRSELHPTTKPISLMGYCIKNSSSDSNIVLDLFLGSGSTMVACHQLNRRCYGMELDPKYCQVIIDRMQRLDPEIEIKKL